MEVAMMIGHSWRRPRQERFHEILAMVKQVHRAFSGRPCSSCGESYVPDTHRLRIDTRCTRCSHEPDVAIVDVASGE
jgi:hypothetical protein